MSRLVFYHPSPDWDGLARVYVEIGRALAARGVSVAMACPDNSVVAAARGPLDLLTVEDRGAWFSDGIRFSATLREYGSDAVVVAGDDEQLLAAWAVRRAGRGAVFRRMRTGVAAPVTVRTRLAVRLAPTWFVHSSAGDAQASEPVKRLRGRIIADLAVDPTQFDGVLAAPTPLGTSTIVIVTDQESQRATAAALRAIAAMRTRGHPIRTFVLGTPHDANEVRVHATALGLGDAVTLLGDPIDRGPLLAAADLVWVTADHDDGGIAALDAMSLGCPVIATRGTMAERYVTHGETGVITERDDALASAALITLMRADAAHLMRMGAAAQADVRARRGLSAVSEAFMNVLQDAAVAQVAA
ncbi:MAG: glycosyltransferase family 4 protein [Gemmatimonadaceae bacterium]|nr:glycosyltransferase family 4 protein [Gemmatimonadaceae bacterium]